MPKLLTLVPFKEHHFAQIRETLGEGWTIESYQPRDMSTPSKTCASGALEDEAMTAALMDATAVIGEPSPTALRAAVDAGAPIKLLQLTWAGTDKYTRSPVAFPASVTLCSAAGGFGQLISQYVMGQVLGIMQNLPAYRTQQPTGVWQDLGPVASLDEAKVLIFGAGNIGGYVAQRMRGWDTYITGVCNHTDTPRENFDTLVTLDAADEALREADVVVCALPNTNETAGWLSEERLRAMKPNAIIVNVGRGNFIDNDALARVLAEGHLRGAALDVTSPEPLPADHALWQEPRCVVTPHISGCSFGRHTQTENNICNICCTNLAALVGNGEYRNKVLAEDFAVKPE